MRREWETATIGFLDILGNHVVGPWPSGRLMDRIGRKERTHSVMRPALWMHSGVDGPLLTASPKNRRLMVRALSNTEKTGK